MMTHDEAITSLLETCETLKETIEQLQKQNAFLTDTIEKNNLGQIKLERLSLLVENDQCKREADIAIKEANQIKSEYESKMFEANKGLADVRKKQSDIASYIAAETEKKIKNIKLEYEEHRKANDKALEKYKAENDKQIQDKEALYKEKNKKYIIVTIISLFFGVVGIIINFV